MVIGPARTRGEIEKPAGKKNMGTWTADVYTPEQQARLGVDEHGYREDQVLQPLPPDQVQGHRLTFKDLETNQDEKAILVGMTFYSVHDVDPQKQCFSAELNVKLWWWEKDRKEWPKKALADWKDDRVRRFFDEDGLENSLKRFKVPMLEFSNHREKEDVGKPFCEVRSPKSPSGEAWPSGLVLYEHRVRGTFNEVFELAHFPYDVQALTVQLRVNSRKDFDMDRYFALNAEEASHALKPRLQHNVKSCEWRLYKPSALAGKYDEATKRPLIYEAYICLWRRHECMSSRRTRDQLPCYCLALFCALRPAASLTRTAFTCATLSHSRLHMERARGDGDDLNALARCLWGARIVRGLPGNALEHRAHAAAHGHRLQVRLC